MAILQFQMQILVGLSAM